MNSCCSNMRWIPDELTGNGKYPMPEHHPDCEHYKAFDYKSVCMDGSTCIIPAEHLSRFLEHVDEEYTVTDIKLTKHQYALLEEFAGY